MTIDSFRNLLENDSVQDIINYINSDILFEFEKNIFSELEYFENMYKKYYLKEKTKFYVLNSFHKETKFKNITSKWILEKLIEIDLEDSINKFGFINILNLIKEKKMILNNLKYK